MLAAIALVTVVALAPIVAVAIVLHAFRTR